MSHHRSRTSTRLKNWDYAQNAFYFITICTKNREHFFGEIIDNTMVLSDIGRKAKKYWYEIPAHFDFVELGTFVVMPNHIHGIINICKDTVGTRQCLVHEPQTRFQNQGKKTVSSIIGSYKSIVTKQSRKTNVLFAWQSRFYDHIIRNESSLHAVRQYIINNPSKWEI